MIFSLASVPKIYLGQEISAQDLNNLAQNTEILEQIVKGPDKLFLSHWKLASPAFSLINQGKQSGDPATFVGSLPSQLISDVDVWEGSFIYREGMHTLRLGFQTFPLAEAGFGKLRGYQEFDKIREQYLPNLKDKTTADVTNDTVGLFLMLRYTDLPLNQIIQKHPKYVRKWVYSKIRSGTVKQVSHPSRNAYNIEDDVTYPNETWTPYPVKTVQNYHQYTLDITDFGFVQGEVVSVKIKLATGNYKPVTNIGRRFYFSMVYANIGHELIDVDWKNITNDSITSISKVADIASNQKALVDYFNKYDNPLRASLWDQVMVGTSYFPIFSRYDFTVYDGLNKWGLNTWEDYLVHDWNSAEARYYLPRRFDLKNTVNISYNVAVNTFTAFSMQCQLSRAVTPVSTIHKPRFEYSNSTAPVFIYSFSGWPTSNRQPKAGYPHVVPAAWLNYEDPNFDPEQRKTNSLLARLGIVNFIGSYEYKNYKTGDTTTVETSILPEGLSTPTGYPNPREFLYMAGEQPKSQDSWWGFYFIRPGFLGDGGVAYYTALGGTIAGKEQTMFFGPKGNTKADSTAAYYVDSFDFALKAQTSNEDYFYPAMYEEYTGIKTHSDYKYTKSDGYTDFTVNLKEASPNWRQKGAYFSTPSGLRYQNEQAAGAFNKASYISTFRLAEVSRKDSGFVRTPIERFESFQEVTALQIINFLKAVNTKLIEVYNYIKQDHTYKYIPLFWTKPKSMLRRTEMLTVGEKSADTLFYNMEQAVVYFSSNRQADYLVVRGKNISIGWGGFTKIFRDNPKNQLFPGPLEITYVSSQGLIGEDIETVVIGFQSLPGLNYGERYYLQGDIYYAAETMGVP